MIIIDEMLSTKSAEMHFACDLGYAKVHAARLKGAVALPLPMKRWRRFTPRILPSKNISLRNTTKWIRDYGLVEGDPEYMRPNAKMNRHVFSSSTRTKWPSARSRKGLSSGEIQWRKANLVPPLPLAGRYGMGTVEVRVLNECEPAFIKGSP